MKHILKRILRILFPPSIKGFFSEAKKEETALSLAGRCTTDRAFAEEMAQMRKRIGRAR